MMLSQFYNRRNSLQSTKNQSNPQEDDIINSFYEERKSRSTQNIKQHNLLRKNISYFHQEETEIPKAPARQEHTNSTIAYKIPQKRFETAFQHPAPASNVHLSRPPIPRNASIETKVFGQTVSSVPLKELSHNVSHISSNFSGINLSKSGSQQQDFKAHLKNQLNKRVNIQHYLSEINQENISNPHLPTSQSKLKYNYDGSVPQRIPTQNISEEFSRISYNRSGEHRDVNESHQSSISSLLQQPQNVFEFSRNSLTDRIQPPNIPRDQSFSLHRHSVPTLGDSALRSETATKKSQKGSAKVEQDLQIERCSIGQNNVLAEDQLQELQENSHPVRQGSESLPTTQKHNLKFFQPQIHAEYKRKIGDLERQLESLRSQHRREDKFIQSIQKMRRMMQGEDEDASLKELWRWIKALPQRK